MRMIEFARWPKAKYVRGPDGRPLMLSDLPPPGNGRWTKRQKAEVVAAVRGGLLTIEEVSERYQMTVEEFLGWRFAYDKPFGMPNLPAHRWHELAGKAKSDAAGDRMTHPDAKTCNPNSQPGHALAVPLQPAKANSSGVVTSGSLAVDLNSNTVEVGGQPIQLTRGEYRTLELLCLRKGMTVTEAMLLNHISGGADTPKPKIIDVYICKLRRKLAVAGHDEDSIGTVWGRGYTLRDPKAKTE